MAAKHALQLDWPIGKRSMNLRVTCFHGEFTVDSGMLRADLCPSDSETGRDESLAKSVMLPPQDAAEIFAQLGEAIIAKIAAMPKEELNRQVPGLGDAMENAQVVE